jgi:hypothetical protein
MGTASASREERRNEKKQRQVLFEDFPAYLFKRFSVHETEAAHMVSVPKMIHNRIQAQRPTAVTCRRSFLPRLWLLAPSVPRHTFREEVSLGDMHVGNSRFRSVSHIALREQVRAQPTHGR